MDFSQFLERQPQISTIVQLFFKQAEQRFCPFGLRLLATIKKDLNMNKFDEKESRQVLATMSPAPESAGGIDWLDELLKTISRILDMITDKEVKEDANLRFNIIKATVFEPAYSAVFNLWKFRKKFDAEQETELNQKLMGCRKHLEKAVEEAKEGLQSMLKGDREESKEHFAAAEKAAHEAEKCFRDLRERKEEILAE